jgi:uncharacterized protein (TIGR03435 family)
MKRHQMRTALTYVALVVWSLSASAQSPTFAVASVKPSQRTVGPDYNNRIAISPTGLTGRNVTLKRLIAEAYNLQPYQVTGGPNWLGAAEYDLDAKADTSATRQQLRMMLQALLTDRFRLAFHRDTKELRVYELVTDKGGPKIRPVKDAESQAVTNNSAGLGAFRGDLQQFANLLALQLTIPVIDDPGRPSIASGAPTPVIDKTGLTGIYEIALELKPESAGDMFAFLQRALPEQLGLKLESRKAPVEILIVDSAEKTPTAN